MSPIIQLYPYSHTAANVDIHHTVASVMDISSTATSAVSNREQTVQIFECFCDPSISGLQNRIVNDLHLFLCQAQFRVQLVTQQCYCYRPRTWESNVFILSVCLSVCPSVCVCVCLFGL